MYFSPDFPLKAAWAGQAHFWGENLGWDYTHSFQRQYYRVEYASGKMQTKFIGANLGGLDTDDDGMSDTREGESMDFP